MHIFLVVVVVLLASCGPQPSEGLHRLFHEYFEDYLRENPEVATSLGRTEHNARWRDWSRTARDSWIQRVRRYLKDLARFEASDLNDQDRLSLRLLRRQLQTELDGHRYDAYLVRMNQLFGLHTTVFLTMREMPARSEEDYENILARLRAVPAYVDQNIVVLREAISEGVVQPRLVVDLIVRQLDAQLTPSAEASPLLAALLRFPSSIPDARRDEFMSRATQVYHEAFQPAWRRLRTFLADEYAPQARATLGVTGLPGGDTIYRDFIQRHTSLPLDAREIHEIGKAEVERIDRGMEKIVEEAGFEGTVEEYRRDLLTNPDYLFATKEQMLAYHRDVAMRVLPELPGLFRTLPRHPFGIRAVPPDREAASASNYNAPAADGSRPGWFNLKTYQANRQSRFDKPALVLHETNPGHHLQLASQLELEGLPEFRKVYHSTAYVEGWALYAESLGGALGVYDDSPSRFGALESEHFRARRLVVDTGLHAMEWTREQAIEFLGDASEVDRYIAWPGQALAYKLGQLKILELRAAACDAYGSSFDLRDFHEAVLQNGPLPLDMLEEEVGQYINRAGPHSSGECPSSGGVASR